MKRILLYFLSAVLVMTFWPDISFAQQKDSTKYTDIYLDTVNVKRKFMINDYTMIGVVYGASFYNSMFNPGRQTEFSFAPGYYGVMFTRYGKMFGYMPYFGFQTGVFWGHEGFKFKQDKTTGETKTLDGATSATWDNLSIPLMAHMHVDFWKMKLMVNAGIYGGYRYNMSRQGPWVTDEMKSGFMSYDNRLDYGLEGGFGIGFIFDPVEIHFNGMVKYAWSSLYEPDYNSQYYYRFSYPFDVMVTAGIYFQLTRRNGKTSHQLRSEAREAVYGPSVQKIDSQNVIDKENQNVQQDSGNGPVKNTSVDKKTRTKSKSADKVSRKSKISKTSRTINPDEEYDENPGSKNR